MDLKVKKGGILKKNCIERDICLMFSNEKLIGCI